MWQFFYSYVCCFCKGQRYKDYQDTLETVEKDMLRNLDLLDLLRRLKMHGFALTSELDTITMKFIADKIIAMDGNDAGQLKV